MKRRSRPHLSLIVTMLALATFRIAFTQEVAELGELSLVAPTIALLDAETLNGALGAYTADTNQIFLSEAFVTANVDNPNAIAAVLLEEVGHAIDAQINNTDSAGADGVTTQWKARQCK